MKKDNMTTRQHVAMLLAVSSAWLFFYLIGIPSNYFTEWDLADQILISLITFFAAVPFIGVLILILVGGDLVRTALWTAFYASVPLFVYDFIAVGVFRSEGFHYLISHWYISIAYVYVWVELPLIGVALKRFQTRFSGNV